MNYVNAPAIARERGIAVEEARASQSTNFVNSITVRVTRSSGTQVVEGAVFGTNILRLVRINDFYMEAVPEGYVLMLNNHDVPGRRRAGRHAARRARHQHRRPRARPREGQAGMAISFVHVDEPVPESVLAELRRAARHRLGAAAPALSAAMSSTVVVGVQWGDEGKGKFVDLLAHDADIVVRFQGGNNAGHTLVVGDEQTVLHLIPSGVLHPGKICVIANGVVVDPAVLVEEITALRRRGYLTDDACLKISDEAHLILPYHKAIDLARERLRGKGEIGTTGRGIGPAYEDKMARTGIRIVDLLDEAVFREKLERNLEEKNLYLKAILQEPGLDFDAIHDAFRSHADQLRRYVADTALYLHRAVEAGQRILFEGAQGTMLDVDHGTYPYVTSSNTVAGAAAAGAGVGPGSFAQGDRHLQGVHHARRQRSLSDRANTARSAIGCARPATSSAPPPAGRGAAAGSTPSSCGRPPA